MSVKFASGSQEWLNIDQNLIGSDVFTWACPVYIDDSSADRTLLFSGDKDASNKYFVLIHEATGDTIKFIARNTTSQTAETSTSITDNTWHHILAYSASATDRKVYIDNAGEGTSTSSVTGVDAITDRFAIGAFAKSARTKYMSGQIAEVAVWNVALTDSADRQALADGVSPLLIKPNNLVRLFTLYNNADLNDRMSPITLVPFNTPSNGGTHPRIFKPLPQILQFAPIADGSVSLNAQPGSLILTGANAAMALGLTSAPGTLLLTGAEATLSVARRLQADPGVLQLTGADAALALGLSSAPGTLLLTGAEATLTVSSALVLQADPGTMILTGAEATLTATSDLVLQADPGTMILTGAEATLSPSVALVVRRGGVRWLLEPDPEIRQEKVKELTALIKPEITPKSARQEPQAAQKPLLSLVADVTARMTPSQQTRVERLLEQTGISLDELLIILS